MLLMIFCIMGLKMVKMIERSVNIDLKELESFMHKDVVCRICDALNIDSLYQAHVSVDSLHSWLSIFSSSSWFSITSSSS